MKRLYDAAKAYVDIIELLERTQDPEALHELEELRIQCHNELMDILQREGIPYVDREHVTRLAYYILRGGL